VESVRDLGGRAAQHADALACGEGHRLGPAAGADVPLTLEVDGKSVPITTCSRSCRSATLTLRGGEHMQVQADGPGAGVANFEVPLPLATHAVAGLPFASRALDARGWFAGLVSEA
jgi:hypothetical protein